MRAGQRYLDKELGEVVQVVRVDEQKDSIYFKGAEEVPFMREEDGSYVLCLGEVLQALEEGDYVLCEEK